MRRPCCSSACCRLLSAALRSERSSSRRCTRVMRMCSPRRPNMDNEDEPKDSAAVNRRAFIAGAATGAAVMLAQQASVANAQEGTAKPLPDPKIQANTRPASDYMVDIFKSFGMEYMFSMCASSFIGIHESVLNYAGNKNPEA